MRQEFVVGLVFDRALETVLLIEKNRPAWQAGSLNGLGGSVNNEEPMRYAVTREVLEESGLYYPQAEWTDVMREVVFNPATGRRAIIGVFAAVHELEQFNPVSKTDEQVRLVRVKDIKQFKLVRGVQGYVQLSINALRGKQS